MTLMLLVYFAGIVDSLKTFTFFLTFVLGVSCLISAGMSMFTFDSDCRNDEKVYAGAKKVLVYTIYFFLFSGLTTSLLPTEKTIYLMSAAYATQKIAENPQVQDIGNNLLKVINSKLETAIDDASKQLKDKTKEVVK